MTGADATGPAEDERLLATYADASRPSAERQAAFEVLVRRFRRRIFAVCVRILGSPQDAEEATQETFVRLARSASSFRGEAALSTWLYRVARNVCTDHVRRDARRPSTPVDDLEGLDDRVSDDASAGVDMGDALRRALDQLDPVTRQLLLLIGVDGWSYAEAGAAFDLPVGTVKSRISRARVHLGQLLAEEDTGDAATHTDQDRPSQPGPGSGQAAPRAPPTSE